MENIDLFVGWNKALLSYFFDNSRDEENEVSLYIDREKIEEIGREKGLGGYDEFLRVVLLSVEERKSLYCALRRRYLGTDRIPENLRNLYRSTNLFEYASIYTTDFSSSHLDSPYLIYVVFAVLMGSECFRNGKNAIGAYITEKLREQFPRHNDVRTGLEPLFDALAKQYPRIRATKITKYPYIGLIRYQLGLSKTQEDILNKAMYNADLSDELPYNQWVDNLVDYVDQNMKTFLRGSKRNEVLKRRISDLRDRFDFTQYEKNHRDEEIQSKGHFVLAVYEDEYSASNDRLVLLTDINNKTISDGTLKIVKGTIDRIGQYAEYNVNHVFIGDTDRAEMKKYSLRNGKNEISPLSFEEGCIVTFCRCNSNYLIQTKFPQKGKETYILVREGHKEKWNLWLENHGSPAIEHELNRERVLQVFGERWEMYKSNQIDCVNTKQTSASVSTITKGGGINCIGKTNVYLISAVPYFEFPEPIDIDKLNVIIRIDNRVLEIQDYSYKIVDTYKLVIDLINVKPCDASLSVDVNIEYDNRQQFHEKFDVTGQDIIYDDNILFRLNMWGEIATEADSTYMQGVKVHGSQNQQNLPQETILYQPQHPSNDNPNLIDPHDPRFYFVNLFAANCSMRDGFSITESRLKKCIRYAVTHLEIDTKTIPTFYRDLRFLLVNSGYMNVDYEHGKYQPIPPTFVKTPARLYRDDHLYMLVGSYTFKFLHDLVKYCRDNRVNMFLHESNLKNSPAESLIPPVILLQYNFNPERFRECTNSIFQFYGDTAIAVNILNTLPTFQKYGDTLEEIQPEVFDRRNLKEPPKDNTFPRIRESKAVGYGAQKWIEKSANHFYSISIPDLAWAKLYCFYEKEMAMCTNDNRDLFFPSDLHLPVMMQRALFISNFGIPQKKKVFLCNKSDSNDKYYNIIKRYNTKSQDQKNSIVMALTGKNDDGNNIFIRDKVCCPTYKLEMWINKNKHSQTPRSLLVLLNYNQVQGIAIRINEKDFHIYFLNQGNHKFEQINSSDVNTVFSRFMTTRNTWKEMGYEVLSNQNTTLPPREEYEIEEIKIV